MAVEGVLTADGVLSGTLVVGQGLVAQSAGPGAVLLALGTQYLQSYLQAPVAMTNATQYYDGPSVTLTPGTWQVEADAMLSISANGHTVTMKVWDGTTTFGSGALTAAAAATNYQINMPTFVLAVAVPTVIKISAKSSGTGDSIQASVGEGNTCTVITAERID